jgi:hypothetical protein
LRRARDSWHACGVRRALVLTLVASIASAAVGCGHRGPRPLPIVTGPHAFDRGQPFFDAVAQAMQALGYTITSQRLAEGRIEARARTRLRGDEQAVVVVQLYREGWISCSAEIPESAARRRATVYAEVERLSGELRERLAGRGHFVRTTP